MQRSALAVPSPTAGNDLIFGFEFFEDSALQNPAIKSLLAAQADVTDRSIALDLAGNAGMVAKVMSAAAFTALVADLDLNKANIDFAGLTARGLEYQPYPG
jgi:hypothetical protein